MTRGLDQGRDAPSRGTGGVTQEARDELQAILDRTQLADRYGDQLVEVEAPSLYEEMRAHRRGRFRGSFAPHLERVRLGDYLERVAAGTCRAYLSQWAPPDELAARIAARLPGSSAPAVGPLQVYIGPAGTQTPLHFDFCDSRVYQVEGSKRWTFVEPRGVPRRHRLPITSQVCHFSRLLDREAMDHWMQGDGVTPLHLDVGPGEYAHVPARWWHFVENLAVSVSVHRMVPTSAQRLRARWIAPWRALLGQRFLSEVASRRA